MSRAGRPAMWPWHLEVGAGFSIPRRCCGAYWHRAGGLRWAARRAGVRVSARKVQGLGITVRILGPLPTAAAGGSQSVPARAGKAAQSKGHHAAAVFFSNAPRQAEPSGSKGAP